MNPGRIVARAGAFVFMAIGVGETVTVTGNPAHTGEPKMFFVKLVRTDGSELLRPLLERFNLIDQQRRERN